MSRLFAAALVLAACGGKGGSDERDDRVAPDSPPVTGLGDGAGSASFGAGDLDGVSNGGSITFQDVAALDRQYVSASASCTQ